MTVRYKDCFDASPCMRITCDWCFDAQNPSRSTPTSSQLCPERWGNNSQLICIKAQGHHGSHDFKYPESIKPLTPEETHTYFVTRSQGLFRCCHRYLTELIQQAIDGKWPRYTDGFRTRCTKCNGWLKLKGDTFTYDLAQGK